jgi:hypothetical protein
MADVKGAGVIRTASRLFVTSEDVMKLLGCKRSYAGVAIRDVNTKAKSEGLHAFPAGKANKYRFSEMFGIPMEDIERVISE